MTRSATTAVPVELARGLAARLRDAAAAADRLADFSFAENDTVPAPALRDGDEDEVAADFTRRAFHAATDAVNARILHAAATSDAGVTVDALAELTGLPRLAVLERVNDILQVGLVARDLAADTVVATGAGAGVDALLGDLGADVAGWLQARRRRS